MRSIVYAGNDFSRYCSAETVLVNDADARDIVALGSDFFALQPGACMLAYSGCAYGEARFRERWA